MGYGLGRSFGIAVSAILMSAHERPFPEGDSIHSDDTTAGGNNGFIAEVLLPSFHRILR